METNYAIDANRPELAGRSHAGCHELTYWFGMIGLKRLFKGASMPEAGFDRIRRCRAGFDHGLGNTTGGIEYHFVVVPHTKCALKIGESKPQGSR
jgi:hypothetical protein